MTRRALRIAIPAVAVITLGVLTGGPALAATASAHPATARAAKPHGSASTSGNDVSYPQCGKILPGGQAFGIVGLNGGLANDLNPCLGPSSTYPATSTELYWAVASSTGAVAAQPKASLYLNTADPGDVYNGSPISDWPTSGTTPYGSCTTTTVTTSSGSYTVGQNSPACAWQYGYDKASMDVSWLASAASAIDAQGPPAVTVPGTASAYPWWLDVETANTWQTGTYGQAMNVADVEGMVAALRSAGATTIGVYSTSAQWSQITGSAISSTSSLNGLPDWIPGARTSSAATSNCGQTSFTGGTITLTQWISRSVDYDHFC
ncbi:MAG: hypothetical protein ACYCO9_11350 [Streptosporangiaceae bacterium]